MSTDTHAGVSAERTAGGALHPGDTWHTFIEIADEMGWTESTLLTIVEGFIATKGLGPELVAHARTIAVDETAAAVEMDTLTWDPSKRMFVTWDPKRGLQPALTAPVTCVLTGADGEDPEDCHTHAHETPEARS